MADADLLAASIIVLEWNVSSARDGWYYNALTTRVFAFVWANGNGRGAAIVSF